MITRARYFRDLTGQTFGYLVAQFFDGIVLVGRTQKKFVVWKCQCVCGSFISVKTNHLVSGHTKSCGCMTIKMVSEAKLRHGENTRQKGMTTEYRSWYAMKTRCGNCKAIGYERYGGRGISVCDRWKTSFENFLMDMGRKPSPNFSIDRINNDGNYEPGNCRWASPSEQRINQRKSKTRGESISRARQMKKCQSMLAST